MERRNLLSLVGLSPLLACPAVALAAEPALQPSGAALGPILVEGPRFFSDDQGFYCTALWKPEQNCSNYAASWASSTPISEEFVQKNLQLSYETLVQYRQIRGLYYHEDLYWRTHQGALADDLYLLQHLGWGFKNGQWQPFYNDYRVRQTQKTTFEQWSSELRRVHQAIQAELSTAQTNVEHAFCDDYTRAFGKIIRWVQERPEAVVMNCDELSEGRIGWVALHTGLRAALEVFTPAPPPCDWVEKAIQEAGSFSKMIRQNDHGPVAKRALYACSSQGRLEIADLLMTEGRRRAGLNIHRHPDLYILRNVT